MTITIAIAALAVSLATFLTGRWRDRRDLLLGLQDRLVSADQQRGRQLIYSLGGRPAEVEHLSDEFVLIINAFAALNVLAIYYRRRYVRRKDALELWASTVNRVLISGEEFLNTRDAATARAAGRSCAHWAMTPESTQNAGQLTRVRNLTQEVWSPTLRTRANRPLNRPERCRNTPTAALCG